MKSSKGFTLVEVMIVIAVITILMGVAIPSYNDYLKRSQVNEALNLLSGLKVPAQEWFTDHAAWTTDISVQLGGKTSGKYVDKIVINGYGFDATFKDSRLSGSLSLAFNSASRTWQCKSTTINPAYLPVTCK
jgi:type IV pilus assembly protein PilA